MIVSSPWLRRWAAPLVAGACLLGSAPASDAAARANGHHQGARSAPATAEAVTPTGVDATPNAVPLSPSQPIPPEQLEAFIDGFVRNAMAADHLTGVTVSVVQDGRTALLKGYGLANLSPSRPVDPNTSLFRIGSLSKTFVWIELMRLVEAGKVRLDAPVNDYLPAAARVSDQGFKPIRVVDLMDHAGGFEDSALGHLFIKDGSKLQTTLEYIRAHRPRRVREPGQFPTYSNYGVALAQQIIQSVTGEHFEDLVERDIFAPLGITHSTFREPHPPRPGLPAPMLQSLQGDIADPHEWAGGRFRKLPYEHVGHMSGVGGGSFTAADMSRYMLMLLADGRYGEARIFGDQAARAFRTPILSVGPDANGWAHGFMVLSMPGGRKGYGHGGATTGFKTMMTVVPDLRLGVFVSANSANGYAVSSTMAPAIIQRFYVARADFMRPGDKSLVAQAKRYAGPFVGTRRSYSGLEGAITRLNGQASVAVTPDGYLQLISGADSTLWVPDGGEGEFVSATGDKRMAFTMKDGRADSVVSESGTQAFQRDSWWMSPQLLMLLGALAAVAAIAAIVGQFTRAREVRPTGPQLVASGGGLIVSILWLGAIACLVGFASGSPGATTLLYAFPGPLLRTGSVLGFLAAVGSIVLFVTLPAIWRRADRRQDGWSLWRRLRHSLSAAIFLVLAVIAGLWGFLTFWS